MYLLGISAYYHDSAACLVKDGEIVTAFVSHDRYVDTVDVTHFPLKQQLDVTFFCPLTIADFSVDNPSSE